MYSGIVLTPFTFIHHTHNPSLAQSASVRLSCGRLRVRFQTYFGLSMSVLNLQLLFIPMQRANHVLEVFLKPLSIPDPIWLQVPKFTGSRLEFSANKYN